MVNFESKKIKIWAVVLVIALALAGGFYLLQNQPSEYEKMQKKVKKEFAAKEEQLRKGDGGFDLVKTDFTSYTEDDIKVLVLRAMQEELTMALLKLEKVEFARVLITWPEKIYDTMSKGGVSVVLGIKEGETLDENEVQAIYNLLSFATNIPKEDISVMDDKAEEILLE